MEDGDFFVEKVGSCVVITMDRGENRINNEFIRCMNRALDVTESYDDATCMVTMGRGKFFSLGLDLEWISGLNPEELHECSINTQKLFARILTFPLVTVAALNGHTYAAGAFLAISHDYMIMRTGKGWFCFPEVKNGHFIPANYINLFRSKVPHSEQHQALVLGKRYNAEEALSGKMVNEICPVEQLKEKAIAAGQQLAGKDGLGRMALSSIKHSLYKDTYHSLMDDSIQLSSAL